MKRDEQNWYYKEYLPKLDAQIDMDGEKKTLSGWLDEWLEVYCAEIEDNTYASYKNNIKHIKKALGGFILCELKQLMVQKF